jgi:hypothetical protein
MAEPENHTLRPLRELRDDIKGMEDRLEKKIDRNHEEIKEHLEALRKAFAGESILGRYATAEFEHRLTAAERRISDLEEQR